LDTAEVEPGEVATAVVNGKELAIVNVDGEFHALDALCPHQDGPLGEGFVQSGCIVCPWHHWEFDVTSGEYLDDPTISVKRYETRVEDGVVMVRVEGAAEA
jgi:nitrite reductase (NADH) small subunit